MTTHATKNALLRLLSILLLVFAAFAGQARALEVPPYEGPVNDRAGFLAEADRARLNADLEALGRDTGVRIAVLTIPSLEGEDLNAFFLKTAQTWGKEVTAGDKDILLLVSSKEGAVRMAVGPGLDTALYNRVLAEETFPYFKARRAGEGLASGLTAMARAARTGTFTPGATARELAAAAQPAAKPAAQPATKPAAQTAAQAAEQAAEQAAALVVAQTVAKPAAKPAPQPAAPPAARPADDPDDGQAQGLKVPHLTGPVNDLAGVLSPETRERLVREMAILNGKTGIQLVLLTIPSLKGEVLEEFALKTAEAWGLGKKGDDKGVLFLVAMKERKSRIEVGYGLEGTLTDLLCSRIIREEVAPAFRAGHPGEGVAGGVAALMEAAQTGKFSPSEAALGFAKMAPAETAPAKPAPAETAPDEASGDKRAEAPLWEVICITALVAAVIGLIVGMLLRIFSDFWWIPGLGGALAAGGVAAVGNGMAIIAVSAVVGMLSAALFAKLCDRFNISLFSLLKRDEDDDSSDDSDSSSSSSGGRYGGGGGGFGGGGASGSL